MSFWENNVKQNLERSGRAKDEGYLMEVSSGQSKHGFNQDSSMHYMFLGKEQKEWDLNFYIKNKNTEFCPWGSIIMNKLLNSLLWGVCYLKVC